MPRFTLGSVAVLLISVLLLSACSTGGSRSTSDARVRSFRGQTPPELPTDGVWLGGGGSLASLRGRVVYVQFTFPT